MARFNTFWDECGKFLNEEIGVAVEERKHGTVTHLGRAISVRVLVDQVKAHCPENTPIPIVEWTCLQFWLKTPAAKSSMQYTGNFRMKFMVQQRQWRKSHVDSHYAAAIFRYIMCTHTSTPDYYTLAVSLHYTLHYYLLVYTVLYIYCIHFCRYMREYALLLRDVCAFVCLDDKHKIKVGKLSHVLHTTLCTCICGLWCCG